MVLEVQAEDDTATWVARAFGCLTVYTLAVYGSLAFPPEWFRITMYLTWWSVPFTVVCWVEAITAAVDGGLHAHGPRHLRAATAGWRMLTRPTRGTWSLWWGRARLHPFLWLSATAFAIVGGVPGLMVSRRLENDGPWRGYGFHPNMLYAVVALWALVYLITGAAALTVAHATMPKRSASEVLRARWMPRLGWAFPLFAALLFLASSLGLWPEAVLDACLIPGLLALAVLTVDKSHAHTSAAANRAIHRRWCWVAAPALAVGVLALRESPPGPGAVLAAALAASLLGALFGFIWNSMPKLPEPAAPVSGQDPPQQRDRGPTPHTTAPIGQLDSAPPLIQSALGDVRVLGELLNRTPDAIRDGLDVGVWPEMALLKIATRSRGRKISARQLQRFGDRLAQAAMALRPRATLTTPRHPNEFELFAAVCVWFFDLPAVGGNGELARRLRLCVLLWKTGRLYGMDQEPPWWKDLWAMPMPDLKVRYATAVEKGLNAASIKPTNETDGTGTRRKHYAKSMRRAIPEVWHAVVP
jgi:hypothetical protein